MGVLTTDNSNKKDSEKKNNTENKEPENNTTDTNNIVKYDSVVPISRKTIGTTTGCTFCKKTSCGTLYITVNKDENGNIVESFVNASKGGICQSNINGLNRMISLALRSGVKPEEIVDQLKGITCPACVKTIGKGNKLDGISCPDIIGKTILEFYNMQKNNSNGVAKKERIENAVKNTNQYTTLKENKNTNTTKNNTNVCPDCGEPIIHDGGCVICTNCGWSKCE